MRDNSISISKAIAIILMVIGHAGCPSILHNLIYQFHIPLFFFFSGYCFKDKHLTDFRTYTSKRITGIYLPYVKYAILFLVLHNLFFYLNIYNDQYGYNGIGLSLYTFKDIAHRALKITTQMAGEEQLLGGYWFMKILFLTSFTGFAFIKYLKNKKLQIVGLVFLYAIVFYITRAESVSSFWNSVWYTCFATLFFMLGKISSGYKTPQSWWFTIVCIAGVFGLSIINPAGFTTKHNILLYVIGALTGILATKNISGHLQNVPYVGKTLVYIGNRTLTILTWHFLCFKLVSLAIIKIYGLPIELLASFPIITEYAAKGWWVAYSLVGVIIPICIALISQIMPARKSTSLAIFCLYILAICYICFSNHNGLPELPGFIVGIPLDKIIHFVMFFPFPLLAYQLFSYEKMDIKKRVIVLLIIVVTGCLVGMATEHIQALLEYRSAEINDFYSDVLGLISGGACTAVVIYWKNR